MSDVLRNLQEFRKEKEKIKLKERQEVEQTTQKDVENVIKKESPNGREWNFLTKAEPVPEDYGELFFLEKNRKVEIFGKKL